MIFGAPSDVTSRGHLGTTNVDEQGGIILSYGGGQLAILYTSIRATTPHEATIMGTEGRLRIGLDWHKPDRVTLTRPGQPDETTHLPFDGNGYNYEAAEVNACLRAGRTESTAMPLDETLAIMRTLDRSGRSGACGTLGKAIGDRR